MVLSEAEFLGWGLVIGGKLRGDAYLYFGEAVQAEGRNGADAEVHELDFLGRGISM